MKIIEFANSADPYKTAPNEPAHMALHWLHCIVYISYCDLALNFLFFVCVADVIIVICYIGAPMHLHVCFVIFIWTAF